jgi:hypothetical protein
MAPTKKTGKGTPPTKPAKVTAPVAKKKPAKVTAPVAKKKPAKVTAPVAKKKPNVGPKQLAFYEAEVERRRLVKKAEREQRILERRKTAAEELAKVRAAKPKVQRRVVGSPKPNLVLEKIPGKIGRPSIAYTDELDVALFELVSTGVSLDDIGMMPNMPNVSKLLSWIHDKDHPFSARYMRAKSVLVTLYEERAQQAALKPLLTELTVTKNSDQYGASTETRIIDNVARSTLIFNAYQWSLSHMLPKKHGKNAEPPSGGHNEQLEALFAALKSGPVDASD